MEAIYGKVNKKDLTQWEFLSDHVIRQSGNALGEGKASQGQKHTPSPSDIDGGEVKLSINLEDPMESQQSS